MGLRRDRIMSLFYRAERQSHNKASTLFYSIQEGITRLVRNLLISRAFIFQRACQCTAWRRDNTYSKSAYPYIRKGVQKESKFLSTHICINKCWKDSQETNNSGFFFAVGMGQSVDEHRGKNKTCNI